MFSSCKKRSPISNRSASRLSGSDRLSRLVLLEKVKVFVAADESSEALSHTVVCGINALMMEKSSVDDLLSGFFSVICTVCPDYMDLAKKILDSLGFKLELIKVPTNFEDELWRAKSHNYKCGPGALLISQLVYVPFTKNYSWSKVAKVVKVDRSFLVSKERLRILFFELRRSGYQTIIRDAHTYILKSLAKEKNVLGTIFKIVAEQVPLSDQQANSSSNWSGKQLSGNLDNSSSTAAEVRSNLVHTAFNMDSSAGDSSSFTLVTTSTASALTPVTTSTASALTPVTPSTASALTPVTPSTASAVTPVTPSTASAVTPVTRSTASAVTSVTSSTSSAFSTAFATGSDGASSSAFATGLGLFLRFLYQSKSTSILVLVLLVFEIFLQHITKLE